MSFLRERGKSLLDNGIWVVAVTYLAPAIYGWLSKIQVVHWNWRILAGLLLVAVAINVYAVVVFIRRRPQKNAKEQTGRTTRPEAPRDDENSAFEIDAQAVSNLQNRTEMGNDLRGTPGWSLDCAISVHNLHPTQGFNDVRLRILSITPPMTAMPSHHPKTQDAVVRCVQFGFNDIPAGKALAGDQTGHVILFRAEKYIQFSGRIVFLTFNGAWPDNAKTAFAPEGQYLMTVEVTGSGVRAKTEQFEITFCAEGDGPVFTIRKGGASSGRPPVLTEEHRHQAWEKDQEARGISVHLPRKREQCLMDAAQLLKSPSEVLWSFNAICRANIDQLDTNDDVVWVCDELAARGYDHPFFGLDDNVPKKDWREFVREAKLRVTTDTTGEYVRLGEKWWELKKYPRPSVQSGSLLRLKMRLSILGRQGA
jgi:hypothetical protein